MDLKALFEQIRNLYKRLNKKQKIVILATIVAIVGFISALIVWNSINNKAGVLYPGYAVLFEGVSPEDGALIIQQLQQDKIPYKIPKDNTILIPQELVYEERMKLASNGIPKSSKVGFEIFDTQDFGATDFDQRIKYLRAIEGELARTIESLSPIQKATVHIAQPEKSVFVSEQTPPTASVVLAFKPAQTLTPKQISGIKNIVSSAIPNLTIENVEVVNEKGEPLSELDELGGARELAAAQLRYKSNFEQSLEEKIINILAPITGGKEGVVAKVTAEFDFAQKESTQEYYDPNNVVRSEQNLEESREGAKPKEIGGVPGVVSNIGPVQGLENEDAKEKYEKSQTTTNYEVSKTISNIKGEFATIRRLSAAVVVDGKYQKQLDNNGVEQLEYIALNQQEMEQITALVRQAIGYNQQRGDEVSVSNFQLNGQISGFKARTPLERFLETSQELLTPFMPLLKYVVVGIILFLFYKKVIVPFSERMLEAKADEEEEIESLLKIEDEEEENTDKLNEVKRRIEDQLGFSNNNEDEVKYSVLLEKIKELAQEKPTDLANLFQTLVHDELGIDNISSPSKGGR
ncbi:flagellar basal-body MS-ring/collar protein FliF [Helicobacter pullorum]|uniref:Flagellar M-ring protein n=2 Tax=Helicobacter pullorum TaxID=35818 RepID=A0A0N1E6Y8_9HELI|nr:flagellar basal-body MS-ring/collar protein FliF [Helicobacter pullorum]HIS08734.1 flagellar M-ring protein FliF [Candidatus Scatomorpha intestinipullorum]EEQ62722.1 flagellar M-ring protein FliF [Helicobacter pullorum MIT 98-5489]KAB0576048.1 flagellar basal body M-ring protein FliF [Helicobacter pullorum NCTC 12824]KPH51388.1 flagellar M-ring protein FliF [Helicobacter pullorum]KPH54195.1 flagellar M-ring protein FliF [Helicobacter pullorum]